LIGVRRIVLSAWFVCTVAGAAAAQRSPDQPDSRSWQAAYDDGLKAKERSDWRSAEQAFRTAIAKGGKDRSQRVLFYGTRREPFYPEYYLAVALMNGGKASEAATLFERIQREKLVPSNAPEFSQIAANLQKAQDLARATPAGPGPILFPGGSRGAAGPGNTTGPNPNVGPSAAELKAQADREARDHFEQLITTGNRELAAKRLPAARQAASDARALGIDAGRVDTLLKRIDIEEAVEGAHTAIAARNVEEARRLTDRLKSLDPANAELPPIVRQIDQLVAAGASAELERTALRRFYNGQYRQALEAINTLLAQSRGSARLYFYAACSNAALALLDEPNGGERLKAARDMFARARPYANELAADRRFVSPRILQALEEGKLP
jgi:hypothetical protein